MASPSYCVGCSRTARIWAGLWPLPLAGPRRAMLASAGSCRVLMDKAALTNEIKDIIIRELKLEGKTPAEIDESLPLFGEGLGLDSLDALQLAMAIEERYQVKIPDGGEERRIFASVASIAEFIARSREAGAS